MVALPDRRWLRARRVLLLSAFLGVATCGEGSTGPPVFAVGITPDPGLAIGVGGTVRYYASTLDELGRPTYTGDPTWAVDDDQIASIAQNGVATAISEGTTVVSATIDGVRGTARFAVYVPEVVLEYVPGTSYFGRNDYVEYIPGELPVVLSAPHGGDLLPSELPNRTFGVTGTDRNTIELTLAVRDALIDLTGYAPHVIISHLHRAKLDPNREIVEAAQGSSLAEYAWGEFQSFIDMARIELWSTFDGGMYFDMHGHGHAKNRLELGYLLSSDRMNLFDSSLNSQTVVRLTSIREIGRDSPIPFSQVLRGPTSLGGYLEAEGVPVLPSPGDPSPGEDPYFTGGYNTRRHGSMDDSEVVSGIQIEHHFPGLRDTDDNRRAYAAQLAVSIRSFMIEHFGFFEPTP